MWLAALSTNCVNLLKIHIRLPLTMTARYAAKTETVFLTRSTDQLWEKGEVAVSLICLSLHAHVDKGRLSYAMNRVGEFVGKLNGCNGEIVDKLRAFFYGGPRQGGTR